MCSLLPIVLVAEALPSAHPALCTLLRALAHMPTPSPSPPDPLPKRPKEGSWEERQREPHEAG